MEQCNLDDVCRHMLFEAIVFQRFPLTLGTGGQKPAGLRLFKQKPRVSRRGRVVTQCAASIVSAWFLMRDADVFVGFLTLSWFRYLRLYFLQALVKKKKKKTGPRYEKHSEGWSERFTRSHVSCFLMINQTRKRIYFIFYLKELFQKLLSSSHQTTKLNNETGSSSSSSCTFISVLQLFGYLSEKNLFWTQIAVFSYC